ncbi:meiotic recombination [Cryptotrichosporon argae]
MPPRAPTPSVRSRTGSVAGGDEASPSIVQQNPDNCFRILLATDNHIGYAEKDPVRGQDALNTFREILQIAVEYEVDFILLAGDLFHENRPSRACMHQTIALLRQYTLGDKPISFELLSDPMDGSTPGFDFPAVNYEDPNLNVAIPVFSIHGNHDDPQGTGPEGALCALDVLSVSGVLNYFGKIDLVSNEAKETDDKGIKIRPILLRKGSTHLAVYGVGNVKDARMHYELRSNRVKMYMPEGGDVLEDDWFNLLLVHQNRVNHGPQQSVPEGMFDDSIKLVVWGHEHDCRIWPEQVEGKPYYITQPGSSVATSLAPGEALPKHVGILSIQDSQFQIAEIPLKTVRPFELDEVVLAEEAARVGSEINLEDKDTITAFLRERVEELIERAKSSWADNHDPKVDKMMLPLIRLKVETSDAKEMTNPVRFGQDFIGRVANPRDILQYYRRKKQGDRKAKVNPDMPDDDEEDWDADDPAAMTTSDRLAKIRMASLVRQYLQAQSLEVLVENGLEDAVMRFVDKDDKDAIKDFVTDTLKQVVKDMRAKPVDEEDVEERMTEAKERASSQWQEQHKGRMEAADRGKANEKGKSRAEESDEDSMAAGDSVMELDSDDSPVKKPKAATKANGAKGRSKQPLFDDASDDDEDEEEEEVIPQKKSRAAPTNKKAPARSAAAYAKKPAAGRGAGSKASGSKQSQLSFTSRGKASKAIELSDSD